ncbi:glycosyltransferase family 4 protein [Sporosarcina jiandibaonis]|uniref:glycosyltransferase family 4 protein n=1 Tax=Sporosarcina jiandibaonis TaxID=2715535 RepID=UPI00155261E5|nr:glycosyltransferase family 4 protein [Sporosarcina jiandibaonis]
MNIWIFNHYAKTPLQSTGTRHYEMAKYLVSRGCKVTIFTSSYSAAQNCYVVDHDNEKFRVENIEGIRFVWLKTTPYQRGITRILSFASYYYYSIKFAKKIFGNERADLILGSTVHPLAALAAYKISKKKKAKFYFEERDLWPQTFIDFGKIKQKHPISKLLFKIEKFLYNKSDMNIVLFDKAVDYVQSKGIRKEKIIHIPNGVNINVFKEIVPSESIDELYKQFEGKFTIIYTGSHGLANDLDKLINLAESVSLSGYGENIHFVSVGSGALKEKLKSKALDKGINNITFLDPVRKVEVPYLLSKADMSYISILDSPLYKWGFSMNKLYDYMAAGLPMIMHANPKIVGEYNHIEGVFVSMETDVLTKHILTLYNNQEKILNYSRGIKEHVESNYSWDVLGERLYNNMLHDIKSDTKVK